MKIETRRAIEEATYKVGGMISYGGAGGTGMMALYCSQYYQLLPSAIVYGFLSGALFGTGKILLNYNK